MNETNTNNFVSGSGTASNPYVYNFHATAQSYGASWMFCALVIAVGMVGLVGFLIGFYFGRRRRKSS